MSNPFLVISSDESVQAVAKDISDQFGFVAPAAAPDVQSAVQLLTQSGSSPLYILADAASRGIDFVNELDALAEHCEAKTKVVVVGDTNDLNLYRQVIAKGVSEYFVKPVQTQDVKEAFLRGTTDPTGPASGEANGKVISFLSAASGDGATTVAINTAYSLASELGKSTVLVDMDYQFGLVARNLDKDASAGLKELYEHPEGTIDQTLIEKTLVKYDENLFIVTAPRHLDFVPEISGDVIANVIYNLKRKFDYVILDLPHVWTGWVANVLKEADKNIITAQLSIKSVTHTARFLDAMRMKNIDQEKTAVVINRSGSKFKEPITANDFAMATKKKVDFYVSNDSKTIALSEDQGKTAVEMGNSLLNKQFAEIATAINE